MEPILRKPKETEVEILSSIALQAKSHWGYPKEWLDLWKDDLTIQVEDLHQFWFICLELDERIIGFTALSCKNKIGEIEHMWISPEYMGNDYGKLLLETLIKHAKQQQLQKIIIVSDPHARGFYEKYGAVLVGNKDSKPKGRLLPVLEINL